MVRQRARTFPYSVSRMPRCRDECRIKRPSYRQDTRCTGLQGKTNLHPGNSSRRQRGSRRYGHTYNINIGKISALDITALISRLPTRSFHLLFHVATEHLLAISPPQVSTEVSFFDVALRSRSSGVVAAQRFVHPCGAAFHANQAKRLNTSPRRTLCQGLCKPENQTQKVALQLASIDAREPSRPRKPPSL